MEIQQFMKAMMDNMPFIVVGMGVVLLIMLGIMINQGLKLSYMKKRYRKMMAGVDGANIERMLMGHIDEVKKVVEKANNWTWRISVSTRCSRLLSPGLGLSDFGLLRIWAVTCLMR